ncbi:PIN domain-like protein [Corynespora cassiicola Philippines]|uniref:PIN domain-like protein n=1 Tax=Corynespora cassiicola Philippines TaxID=1448308 RepID=A0A2T2NBE2_CORCC|nr:PIN domain-like protein [Corynespora cassiicola Philippines]
MGISGLLPLLKSIHQPCNLKKFSGKTIGVDAYGWLHRGTAACAIDLAMDKPTTKFVDFAMNRVRMLIHFGVIPYLVFDGDNLPSKAGTEKERRNKRKEGKRLGLELLKLGKTSQAQLELQKAVDVTPEMARMLIDELKHHNIQYIVAPYEADSQLAYLERKGIIDGILSEDSDLLVFGAKCLITKLDKFGECVEINRNRFTACREVSLVGWSDADFRRMAMLSGCDYLPGIGGMGLKTAHRMLRKHKTVERLLKVAQFDGKLKVPQGFMEAFMQAERTFLYQWVFCPLSNQLVNLTVLEDGLDITQMPFLGAHVPQELALGVSRGELHPHTKERLLVEDRERPYARPLRPAPTTSRIAQTPDTKSKPIEDFFKPKRTPLAELDPNSLQLTPSQQALLERQSNNNWAAVLAPQPHTRRDPSTAPQPARRTMVAPLTSNRSAPKPQKRQRLCSDSFETPVPTERSPFFASSEADPSPSIRPRKRSPRKSNQDFELYSDDSVEEALAEFVDLEEAASKPKKKMKIFKESDFGSSMGSDSQSTVHCQSVTSQSQGSIGTLTPATSIGSPEPELVPSQMKDLRSRFSFNSSSSPAPLPNASVRSRKSITRSKAARIGATLELTTDISKTEAAVMVAASPERPSTSGRLELKGSEDLLVPESDDESVHSPRKPMLNLGRFAFAG